MSLWRNVSAEQFNHKLFVWLMLHCLVIKHRSGDGIWCQSVCQKGGNVCQLLKVVFESFNILCFCFSQLMKHSKRPRVWTQTMCPVGLVRFVELDTHCSFILKILVPDCFYSVIPGSVAKRAKHIFSIKIELYSFIKITCTCNMRDPGYMHYVL